MIYYNLTTMKQYQSKLIQTFHHFKNQVNAKVWTEKSIVVYAGTTPYPHYDWSPLDLQTGLGGSEIAIINLAKEWVKLGYQVTVYNSCREAAGIYEGVNYVDYSKFNRHDTFNTLLIWRFPWILYPHTRANQIWLDLHEVLQSEQITKKNLAKFDKIFVKSQYQRETLPEIEDNKICIVSNGIERRFYDLRDNKKNPYKLIYASNYTRGLEKMLTDGWPIIKREIPQATLHIYYGFPAINPQIPNKDDLLDNNAWLEKMKTLMTQPGITEHGRIGLDELMQEKSTAAIHYYASTFQEIDCITVRESALVGCVPVTTRYAALKEKSYCISIPGNPHQSTTQEAVAWEIVKLLKNPDKLASIRQAFQDLAKEETWENIAQVWLASP